MRGSKTSTLSLDVVIVTRNRPEQLFIAVSALLANTILPSRLIIIDSSTQTSNQHLFKERITTLCQKISIPLVYSQIKHRGISYARKMGLKKLTSDLFAFIDDDELVTANWVSTCLKQFANQPDLTALSGPKIPSNLANYWHRVWNSLSERGSNYIGEVSFISAGNSAYRTSFIKSHKLTYDERMSGVSSEDSVFSHRLHAQGAKMFFHKDLIVYHNQRSDIVGFIKQWFTYGKGTYFYQHLYHPVSTKNPVKRVLYIFSGLLDALRFNFIPYTHIKVAAGNLLKDIAFTVGFFYAWGLQKE